MKDPIRLDPLGTPPIAGGTAPARADSPRFQELLERLQRLAAEQKQAQAPADQQPDDPDRLQQALRTADDGFTTAMDLRQKLEEAFRKHMP
jgi:hypothetical protein